MSTNTISSYLYLLSAVFFILALKNLSHPRTAKTGNVFGILGMAIAIFTTLYFPNVISYLELGIAFLIGGSIGTIIAYKIKMTALPQLVAFFHSLVGLAAVFVAASALYFPQAFGIIDAGRILVAARIEMLLGATIGALTFTGSLIAFGKLNGLLPSAPVSFKFQHIVNLVLIVGLIFLIASFATVQSSNYFWYAVILAGLIGILIIIPIGGADMPVVISMLNSYSGWAACGIGFTLSNISLIITGALVGSSGAILSYIMCKGMNRSFISVILGGFGGEELVTDKQSLSKNRKVNSGSSIDAAYILKNAESVIIVPGYGLAVAQAQFALKEIVSILEKNDIDIKFAIHPVAGRMPGHMNVLLAEAAVDYEKVFELDEINRDFIRTDVVLVIGANDVTNPLAKTDKTSPIYGMPVLDIEKSKQVLFIKRSLSAGYAGVDNPVFYNQNTMMLFDDARNMCEAIIGSLEELDK